MFRQEVAMSRALLISSDAYIISEFQQIAEVTGALIEIVSEPETYKINQATQIFVGAEINFQFETSNTIWIVTSGPPGPTAWQTATRLGADQIVSLPAERSVITESLTSVTSRRAQVTSFIGLNNGVGTSTLACHVASSLSRAHDGVALVDMHVFDGGLDIALGHEHVDGVTWFEANKILHTSKNELASRLPRWNELAYLAAPLGSRELLDERVYEALDVVLDDFTHVVIDGDYANDVEELFHRSDNVCFVVANSLRGIALAQARLKSFEKLPSNVGLAVREIPGCAIAPLLVAQTIGLPLWGSLPSDSRVAEVMEQGLGPIPIRSGSFNRSIGNIVKNISNEEVQSRVA